MPDILFSAFLLQSNSITNKLICDIICLRKFPQNHSILRNVFAFDTSLSSVFFPLRILFKSHRF